MKWTDSSKNGNKIISCLRKTSDFFNSLSDDHYTNRYFAIAQKISLESPMRARVGACLIHPSGKIYSSINTRKTHPLVQKYCNKAVSRHAEINCIISCFRDRNYSLEGATLFVYRETRTQYLGRAKPCSLCYPVLKTLGIKKLYYTTLTGHTVEIIN